MAMEVSDVPPSTGYPVFQKGAIVSLSLPGSGVQRVEPGEHTLFTVPWQLDWLKHGAGSWHGHELA